MKRTLAYKITYLHRCSLCPLHFSLGSWHTRILPRLLSVQAAGDTPRPLAEVANGSYISEPGNRNSFRHFFKKSCNCTCNMKIYKHLTCEEALHLSLNCLKIYSQIMAFQKNNTNKIHKEYFGSPNNCPKAWALSIIQYSQ